MATKAKTVEETPSENDINLLNEESEENTMAENEVEETKIKRSAYASFLNIGTKSAPVFKRMGKGISEMDLDYNAEEESEKYIHEDSATHSVESYAPASDVEQKCYKNEPIFSYVDAKRRKRAVEGDAETQRLDVFLYDKKADRIYAAELSEAIIVISKFSGNSIGYAVKNNGDPKEGYATIAEDGTVTFTEGEYKG